MHIIPSNQDSNTLLPLKLIISFESVFEYLETISKNEDHVLYPTAVKLLDETKDYKVLREGFEDKNYLFTYEKEIDRLLDIMFPELLQTNEIKAASIPFDFTLFKFSSRFKSILEKSGDNYELEMRDYDNSMLYIMSCTFILAIIYKENFDFKRPFFYDIPDMEQGVMRHYRALFNGDFFKVKPLPNAPKLTEEDIQELLDNFTDLDLWMEKFPPDSYEFKGFGILNLFDVTADQALQNVNYNLIKRDVNSINELESSIANLFKSKTLKFGFSIYNVCSNVISSKNFNSNNSFLHNDDLKIDRNEFDGGILKSLFEKKEAIAISDLETHVVKHKYNKYSKILLSKGFKSVILMPIDLGEGQFGVIELVSNKKNELNSVNAFKLKDVIPVFEIATERFMEEYQNKLESIIQENYTSIHPAVRWKFYEEAEEYMYKSKDGAEKIELKNIVFDNVVPLYGQSDIRNSSVHRNLSIQEDLVKQLKYASEIMSKAEGKFNLPIYKELSTRIKNNLNRVNDRLHSGDEKGLIEFLKNEIYPVFDHLKSVDIDLAAEINIYMDKIDDDLQVIYDKRKKYENSVNVLNGKLADFIDEKQIEAQKMFPHYFERYKTDGIEYNMYIGASLVNNHKYHELYLQNLRLWQMEMMCELENVAVELKNKLDHPLEVASLILVHNSPMSIEFRIDEKRFDVDGAYNIRYEIIKKRIDKARIVKTNERLTQPGKIAIVYSQKKDALEYRKYIKHLQSTNYLNPKIEDLEIEELQGVSGLRALRVEVNYDLQKEKNVSLEEIMKVIKE